MTDPSNAPIPMAGVRQDRPVVHVDREPNGMNSREHYEPTTVDALYERVKSSGAKIDRPHDFGFMKGFYFYDPDGYTLELFQPAH